MTDHAREPRATWPQGRFGGMPALRAAIAAAGAGAASAVYLQADPAPDGSRQTADGNGGPLVPTVAAPLAEHVRGTDAITVLGDDAVLCTLPGLSPAAARRRFDRVGDRFGCGRLRLGIVGVEEGDDAAALIERARGAALEQSPPARVRLALELRTDAKLVGRARAAMTVFESELRDEELSVLKLVVSALVTNAVRRDPSGSEARLVHLDVAVTRDGVHGSVDWFPERLSLDGDEDDGAMELRIVAAATTRWGIQDDGRRVWFDLARRGRELGPRPGLQNG